MTGRLRRLFGGGNAKKRAAPLNNFLLLVVGRQADVQGSLRASAPFGGRPSRRMVSIYEMTGDEPDRADSTTELAELVADLATRLDTDARSDLFDFIRSTVAEDLEKPGAYALGQSLLLLREQLRRPLPALTLDSGEPAVLDIVQMVDERSFWVVGWCIDGNDMLSRLELVSPEGTRAGTLEGAFRYSRADVEENWAAAGSYETRKHGYTKYVDLPVPSLLSEGWIAEVRTYSGARFKIGGPPVVRDPAQTREAILAEALAERPGVEELRREHAYPALKRLQAHVRKSIGVDSAVQHGQPPSSPDISIVVPLYGRIDLVEHQVAQFWQDPDFATAELIYVLDSPEFGPGLTRLAAELHELYGLPLKVLRLNRNAGYAVANNIGASHAHGRRLLLLNSDVLPTGPGWLSTMSNFYEAAPDVGALGPKLLYEDDSIQHAGMYFERDAPTGWWENYYNYKGFSRTLPAANVNRPVPAVTGACLMIDRSLYQQVGGLCEDYIQGGYEDSDLCLRLIEAGYENWYLASVELYHLEAQSFPIHLRVTNPYNAWLQTHLWNGRIRELMDRQAETTDANVVAVG